MLLAYDEDRFERVFVAKVVNRGDIAKMLTEIKAEVAEGEQVMIEIWRVASDQQRQKRIAERRLAFFSS